MTAREKLNRRQRSLATGLFGGFALVFSSAAIGSLIQRSPVSDYLLVPAVIGIAIVVFSMFVIQFGIRCPICKLRLGHLLLATGHIWGFGKNFNFCPKCGTSLDKEVVT
jgi:hypothetical protein